MVSFLAATSVIVAVRRANDRRSKVNNISIAWNYSQYLNSIVSVAVEDYITTNRTRANSLT